VWGFLKCFCCCLFVGAEGVSCWELVVGACVGLVLLFFYGVVVLLVRFFLGGLDWWFGVCCVFFGLVMGYGVFLVCFVGAG